MKNNYENFTIRPTIIITIIMTTSILNPCKMTEMQREDAVNIKTW